MENYSGSCLFNHCCLFVFIDKPGPPEAPLEVTDVTAESAKLAWNPPKDDGGSRITNYVVEKREGVRSWNKVGFWADHGPIS